jgi:hypothetical protein
MLRVLVMLPFCTGTTASVVDQRSIFCRVCWLRNQYVIVVVLDLWCSIMRLWRPADFTRIFYREQQSMTGQKTWRGLDLSPTRTRRKWNCFFQRFCDGWSVPSFAEECSHRRRESAISAGSGWWVRFDTLADIYLKSLAQLRQWEVRLHISTTELPLEFSNKLVKED